MSPSDLLGVADGLRNHQPPRQVGRTTLLGLTSRRSPRRRQAAPTRMLLTRGCRSSRPSLSRRIRSCGRGQVAEEGRWQDWGRAHRRADEAPRAAPRRRPPIPCRPRIEGATMPPMLKLTKPMTSGPAVRQLQQRLKALGYDLAVDGAFGSGTAAAVKRFQAAKGLTADGVVG